MQGETVLDLTSTLQAAQSSQTAWCWWLCRCRCPPLQAPLGAAGPHVYPSSGLNLSLGPLGLDSWICCGNASESCASSSLCQESEIWSASENESGGVSSCPCLYPDPDFGCGSCFSDSSCCCCWLQICTGQVLVLFKIWNHLFTNKYLVLRILDFYVKAPFWDGPV